MKLIKKYWFGTLITLIVLFFVLLSTLVMLSPSYDLKERGFTPCLELMKLDVMKCGKEVFCTGISVIKNVRCNTGVVFKGAKAWVSGEQKTPWENYIFEQMVEIEDEELLEYYKENPNIIQEMQDLQKKHEELENGQK